MKDIMDLNVYTESLEFSNTIWKLCKQFNYFDQRTLGIQLVRSIDSISANIAEGFGRFHYKENIHFCYYARGSVEEAKDWLRKAFGRELLPKHLENKTFDEITIISKKLNSYINSIKARSNSKY